MKIADALVDLLNGFSHKRAVRWLQEKFDAYDPEAGVAELKAFGPTLGKTDREYFAEIRPMGFVKGLPTKDGLRKTLVVAAVKMARDMTERTSRSKQFALAKNLIATAFAHPECCRSAMGRGLGLCTAGLFFFHDENGNFRISLVTCALKGRKLVPATAKRQSFFCRVGAKNNIVKRQLDPPLGTFEDLEKAFSVEAVTKEFYRKLFGWYEWACDRKTGLTFPNRIHDPNDDREKLPEAIIRLITRLMFVWFVRQKGLVSDDLFDRGKVGQLLKDFEPNAMNDSSYYRAILQNLFFATLNCPEEKRRFAHQTRTRGDGRDWGASDHGCPTLYRYRECFADAKRFEELMRQIPFLNCALFDCLDKRFDRREDADEIVRNGGETEIYLDGFSRDKRHQAFVPNALFFYDRPNEAGHEGLVALFDQYEFTVDENTADDADVALDPELLGKVFENLLGAFNPETKEVARNATGSFYTPREIVDYMTDESLKNYLKTKVPTLADEPLKRLFDRSDEVDAHAYLRGETVDAILDALYSIKILDPACGSGAFPMGLLQRITRLFDKLDSNCTSVRREIRRRYERDRAFVTTADWTSEKERAERLADIEEQYKTNLHHPDYTRKLFIIENCIYGVDIQPIATQISKLRFFISLLCDQLRRRRAGTGARQDPLLALPNLEAKFVCANTLVALPKLGGELNLTPEITKLREKLAKQRQRYFFARTYATKQRAQAEERQIRREIKAAVKHALCTPDEREIARQTAIVSGLEREYEKIREPRWVDSFKPRQGDLFGGGLDQMVMEKTKVDANARRRSEIEDAIQKARGIIEEERAKATRAQTGSAADDYAEQVANWDPYDQNHSSPFFDPDWMFGIKDGFDIVIGNPPYGAKVTKKDAQYYQANYPVAKTISGKQKGSTDTFAVFINCGFNMTATNGGLTYIVPMSVTSSDAMQGVHNLLFANCLDVWVSSYSNRPRQIFEAAGLRCSILQCVRTNTPIEHLFTTKMMRRRMTEEIGEIISQLSFGDTLELVMPGRLPKAGSEMEISILRKMFANKKVGDFEKKEGDDLFYRSAGGRYWNVVTNYTTHTSAEKSIKVSFAKQICACMSSTCFWFYQQCYTDGLNLKISEVENFPVPDFNGISKDDRDAISALYDCYVQDIEKNARSHESSGNSSYNVDTFKEYKIGYSKNIIDEIDDFIGPLYGLTKEEIEFIKNYEIEYRMADYLTPEELAKLTGKKRKGEKAQGATAVEAAEAAEADDDYEVLD